MSTNSWSDAGGNGSPQPPQHQTSSEDEEMIKHLASRYSAQELARLFRKAGVGQRFAIADDQASIISTSTYQSSAISDDAPSIFDSGASIRSFSDTSSISSTFSSLSNKLLGRKGGSSAQAAAAAQAQVQAAHAQTAATWDDDGDGAIPKVEEIAAPPAASTIAPAATKQKASFKCGFCEEEDILKTCTRKNDLKRHIEDFHNMNAQWFCRHRGCLMVFDWQGAYKSHLKAKHGGSRMSLDEAKVNLCPQVVFACGFENCTQVFEAPGDAEAGNTFKDYVGHVVKHFDEGAQCGDWSYSTRMRNLLRQSQVNPAWSSQGWPDSEKGRLQWNPQTSGVLRKRLECRHVGDVNMLIGYAIQLGTDARAVKLRDDFCTPVKDTCIEASPGHVPRKAAAMASEQTEEQFQFRIPRGANPALAQYINSQRRIVVNRHHTPTRRQLSHTGRPQQIPSSRPPTSTPMGGMAPNSHQNQYYFTSMPESHPTSPSLYGSTPQPYSPTTSGMMSPTGGIIADDLRNLRTIAHPGSSDDIEMADSPTMLAPDFSTAYSSPGLQSHCGTDAMSNPMSMETNASFYQNDQQMSHSHGY